MSVLIRKTKETKIQEIDRNLTKIQKNISGYNDTASSKFQKNDQSVLEIQRNIRF